MKLPTVWPRQPFIGLALAALGGIGIGEHVPYPDLALVASIACAVVALVRGGSVATYLFVAASFFFLHSTRLVDAPGVLLARDTGDQPRAVIVRGLVTSEPQVSARGVASFLLRLSSIEEHNEVRRSRATISARWRGDAQFGDELQLFGVVQPIDGPRNPGELDMRAYLARRDIHDVLIARYGENGRILGRGGGNSIVRAAQSSRQWMQATLARGLEDSPDVHGLISAMVLGLREETREEIEEQFQQTGTIHLFSVSGLHVGIVAYLLWAVATVFRVPRKWAVALIIPALFFYAAITGLNTASIRAALMAAILLGGVFVDRRVLAGNSLAAAAVIILAFDTNQLFSIGFQLSFAVVSAIVVFAEPLFVFLQNIVAPDPFLPRSLLGPVRRFSLHAWRAVARGASVSLSAWVGSLLLILPYFYLVAPVSLFANLVVVPIAFFVLAVGLMSLIVAPVASWLTIIFNNTNWALSSAILFIVGLFAQAPAGHYYVEAPHWPSGARVEATVLDLEAGAAVHVRTRQSDWLFDCGPERDFKRLVRSYLRSRGINRLDGLVLTHGDSAHIGAAAAVVRTFHPARIIDTGAPDRSSIHRRLLSEFRQQHTPRELHAAADEWSLARDVTARVLFPPPDFSAPVADNQAMVVQLTAFDRWRILLMSDSGEPTERFLLNSGADLRSDVVIKGQHRTDASGTSAFLDRVQPEAIITTSSDFSQSERVHDDWAEMIASRGIKLLRQDETGAVQLRFFRDHWEAKPFLGSGSFRSRTR
ncbi:MAG: ComEC/Rec2 family competence protein [Chthoniobacterales bacterium]|nr:ComEC/Rec2 family competence protein [Chthoniobacterales bacterium]